MRKEEALAPSNLLIRACAAIVKSSKLCTEESEGWNKTLKLIRRVLESALADGSADSLILVLELMDGGDKWEVLLSEETFQLARNIALGKITPYTSCIVRSLTRVPINTGIERRLE